ncbi:L-Fucosyltransferase [Caenorhabditis elegans]|uniref:L-Fucosyltransferase n=1 Tax=Caenorhabditis elegans TaxID=6239 RepID=Q23217_CAEEL|nr:L-Fucosyltransferase [Caenorhabditis elegans]CAB01447.3 L-Fucosyltransferase [Caenorhabditis elegans]|eukprot:NP_506258.3 Uncharacterized protein CELE_W07G4.2 [Caenorhabditis elegans]
MTEIQPPTPSLLTKMFKTRLFVIFLILTVIILSTNVCNRTTLPITSEYFTNSNKNKKYLSSRLAAGMRLGNHIFEMAALLGMSRQLHRKSLFFVEDKTYLNMLNKVKEAIPGLIDQFEIVYGTVPPPTQFINFNSRCCVYVEPTILENNEDQYLHLAGYYYQSWKYFPSMQHELIKYLKPNVKSEFGKLPRSKNNSYIICAHTRRGDFVWGDFAASDPTFVRRAVEFIEKKKALENLKSRIVLFGDDFKFMKSIFKYSILQGSNTRHFISHNSPSDDLIYSRDHCDTVLISAPHSTFGWWMGYFSKGNEVFYMDIRETNDFSFRIGELSPYDYFMPNWTPLKFSCDNLTIVESVR